MIGVNETVTVNVGETKTVTGTYTVSQEEIDKGVAIKNVATVGDKTPEVEVPVDVPVDVPVETPVDEVNNEVVSEADTTSENSEEIQIVETKPKKKSKKKKVVEATETVE